MTYWERWQLTSKAYKNSKKKPKPKLPIVPDLRKILNQRREVPEILNFSDDPF